MIRRWLCRANREGREYDALVEADAAVVARVADGDTDALRQLYDRYGRIVYGMTYRLTKDAQLAEEATQDTFVTVWRRAGSYDPERAKLTTWLFVIARNRAIELVRARARRPEPHEDVEPSGEEADAAEQVDARRRRGADRAGAGRAARAVSSR